MRFKPEYGCLGVPECVDSRRAFGQNHRKSFKTTADAETFLARTEFPYGRIFVTTVDYLQSDDRPLHSSLGAALHIPTFHLIVVEGDPSKLPTYISAKARNIHLAVRLPGENQSTLTHHCAGIKTALEFVWLRGELSRT